jgi:hypothetical protein
MTPWFSVCAGFLVGRSPTTDVRADDPGSVSIRCPVCRWEPSRTDRWSCIPGCSYSWNTFDTRGVCPGCSKRWHETACHRCHAWSPHDDWYVVSPR